MPNATAEKDLLTTPEAAELLGVSPKTLEVWRCTKRYPLAYVKIGAAVRYQKSAILAFIASRTVAA
jgi:excisionase family DNA binding protein